MTLAICLKCGTKKLGAISPCDKCGYLPEASSEQAKSILLSDHYLAEYQIEEFAEKIRKGEAIEFDENELAEFTQTIEESPESDFKGGTYFWWGLLAVMCTLLAFVLYSIWKLKFG